MGIEDVSAVAWVFVGVGVFFFLSATSHYCCNSRKYDVKGKTVVITGGSSGIGKAVAKVCILSMLRLSVTGTSKHP
jgi:NADPH:quinone reductase-like Zn-dependent oxidoreductase